MLTLQAHNAYAGIVKSEASLREPNFLYVLHELLPLFQNFASPVVKLCATRVTGKLERWYGLTV